uniref:FtsK/SpoIIIE family DNA translocase n=1 Tax=Eubacterium cellulosolvens TaxID=29322 RepID=UPI0009E054DC
MQEQKRRQLMLDMEVIVAFVAAVLIFLSCLDTAGAAGKILGSFLFGMFGIPAFLFAFLFLYMAVLFISNGRYADSVRIAVSLAGIYVFLCSLFQLILKGYLRGADLKMIYDSCSTEKAGGGLVGGMIVQFFGMLFGTVGAYVITLAALLVCTILLTQRPVISSVREKKKAAYEGMTPEEIELEKEKKRVLRQEKRDAAKEKRDLAASVRMQKKKRQQEAKLITEHAKLVEPQKITDTGNAASDPADLFQLKLGFDGEPDGEEQAEKKDAKRSGGKETETFMDPMQVSVEDAPSSIRVSDIPDDIIDTAAPERELPDPEEIDDELGMDEVPTVFGRKSVKKESAAAGISDMKELSAGDEEPENPAPESVAEGEQKYARKGRPSVGEVEKLEVKEAEEIKEYMFPPLNLLQSPKGAGGGDTKDQLKETALKLQQVLHTFGVEVSINHISCGPTVTRYELTPQMGVKVSKILSLQDDIKLNLAAADIRIEAPIPGKAAIGIEVPNKSKSSVLLRELLDTDVFRKHKSPLAFAVGKDIAGQPVIGDIAKMPHLLIAGATGSGKSVFINTLIMSIIYKAKPDDVKFIMVDPKVVELSVYNGIPHMLIPVVTDPKKAAAALNWAVAEMTDRYAKFAELGARDVKSYNAKIATLPDTEDKPRPKKMSRIVIIVDELADLMMVAQNEVEDAICRLAQLARACGIHLVIATQRPSVNVITGLIKANMPSRVALSVTSGVDSRTIIDMNGAEKLLGNGDMLYYPQGYQKPARLQGAFLSDDEIAKVGRFLKDNHLQEAGQNQAEEIQKQIDSHSVGSVSPGGDAMDTDEYFTEAGKLIINKDKASIGMLQRAFRIGFNRAARIMEQLYDAGVVGAEEGTKPRKVLMTMEEFDNYLEEN